MNNNENTINSTTNEKVLGQQQTFELQHLRNRHKTLQKTILSDLVQSAIYPDKGDHSEEYEEEAQKVFEAKRKLVRTLGTVNSDCLIEDLNTLFHAMDRAVGQLLIDVYKQALQDSNSKTETFNECNWFIHTNTAPLFYGLPTEFQV